MEAVAPANGDLPSFGAMHAFALELNRELERCERVATRALEMDVDTPWAHHALAHLFLTTDRTTEGRATIGRLAPLWTGHGQGIRTHNAWHLALLDLASGDVASAWRTFDDHIA